MKKISQKAIEEKWYVINADGLRIGRIASVAAQLLMGKKDVLVRGYHDPRAHVVITNASRIDFTQKRGMTKFYSNYSGFPGGIKFTSLEEAFKKDPTWPIENAVKGMLPKTKRGNEAIVKLKIYAGGENPHNAQNPVEVNVNNFKL